MKPILSVLAVALALLAQPAVAAAPPAANLSGVAPTPLTLPSAVRTALRERPELKAFVFTLRRQKAQEAAAALRPAPTVEVLVEDAFGTGIYGGLQASQLTLSLGQVVELGGKRAGREAVAAEAGASLRTTQAARQLDVVAEVTRRYVVVLLAQQRLQVSRDGLALAESARTLVQQRVDAARAPPAEAARAQGQLIEARLTQEGAEQELQLLRHELAAAMGLPQADFGALAGELLELPPVASFADLSARLDATPDLLQFADTQRLREAELRLAQLQSRPDLRFTLGARRFGQDDSLALVAGVSLPLFAARHAAPGIEAARAARDEVGLEREATWLQLQSQLQAAHYQLEHARHRVHTLGEQLLPQLAIALEQSAYAYERGRYSWLEWTAARRDLLAARLRQLEAAHDFHLLHTEIERLTGASLDVRGDTQ